MSMTVEEAIAIIEDVTWKDFGRHYGKVPVAREMAILALEEVQKYRAIGTVSEFRELKEKATAKAPYLFGDGYFDGVPIYDEWNCPNCDENYDVDFDHYEYCPKCGQRIDWSEGKE